MQDSVFTKIIKGEIPSVIVYEDEKTLAIMDIQPIQPGQIVVMPKQQVDTVWDLAADDYACLMETVRRMGQRMRQAVPGALIAVNIEGLGVKNHAHVKVFPFTNGQEYHHDPTSDPFQSTTQLETWAQKLRLP